MVDVLPKQFLAIDLCASDRQLAKATIAAAVSKTIVSCV